MIRLNIGAGTDIRPKAEGWTNCDIRDLPGIDVVCDARHLPFEDDYADYLLAQDIVEHIPQSEIEFTLREWFRVLKPGGAIELRTPNWFMVFRAAITRRIPVRRAFELLFGDQSPEAGGYEWGGHKNGFSISEWEEVLKKIGFEEVDVSEHEHEFNLYIAARKSVETMSEPEPQLASKET